MPRFIAWRDYRDNEDYEDSDVYAQRVLSSGLLDPAWPAGGLLLCAAPGSQDTPHVVADGTGGAIVAWGDGRGGTYDTYVRHVLASGALDPAWPVNGRALGIPAVPRANEIVADGAGGVIVAWPDFRNGTDYDLFAQHVLADGSLEAAWPSGGLKVCASASNQEHPAIVSDGAGGALLAWRDDVVPGDPHVFAQHVTAGGVVDPVWPAQGRAVTAASGFVVAPDRQGGLFVVWEEAGVEYDIFAHHVTADGSLDPVWPVAGQAVCTAPRSQLSPVVTGDGVGGAIIAWTDSRSGISRDIYAQRISGDGQLGGVVTAVPERPVLALALDRLSPNPRRGGPITIRFTLATEGKASLELLDVAGRRVDARQLDGLGAGRHEIRIGAVRGLRPGVYLVCLRQGRELRTARAVVLD